MPPAGLIGTGHVETIAGQPMLVEAKRSAPQLDAVRFARQMTALRKVERLSDHFDNDNPKGRRMVRTPCREGRFVVFRAIDELAPPIFPANTGKTGLARRGPSRRTCPGRESPACARGRTPRLRWSEPFRRGQACGRGRDRPWSSPGPAGAWKGASRPPRSPLGSARRGAAGFAPGSPANAADPETARQPRNPQFRAGRHCGHPASRQRLRDQYAERRRRRHRQRRRRSGPTAALRHRAPTSRAR